MKGLLMSDIEHELRALGERVSRRTSVLPPTKDIVRRVRLRRFAAGLASLALVAVAGLGGVTAVRALAPGTGDDPEEGSVLATAATATEEAGTARAEFEMSMKTEGGVQSLDIEATGTAEMDFDSSRSYMKFEMVPNPAEGSGIFEIIQDGNTLYAKADGAASDQWMKTTPTALTGGAGEPLSGPPSSPDAYLDQLLAIAADVETVGADEVDGVSTTHYRATVDLASAMSQPRYTDEQVQEAMDALGVEYEPMHVWVDSDHLVRKMTFGTEMDMGGATMRMDFTMRFYDFGAPIDIEIPDPEDVVEPDGPSLGGIFGGAVSAKKGVTKYPIKTTFLFTRKGYSGPVVTIQESQPFDSMCVVEAPRWVRIAQVVERESGESIAVMGEITVSNSFTHFGNKRSTCQDQIGDVSDLKKHPKLFDLMLIGKGRNQTLGLTLAQEMFEPEE